MHQGVTKSWTWLKRLSTQIYETNTEIKAETDSDTITVGNFKYLYTSFGYIFQAEHQQRNTGFKWNPRPDRLTHIYRTFHPKEIELTVFSYACGVFWTDYLLGHKISLNELKKLETISSIFSNPTSIYLDSN